MKRNDYTEGSIIKSILEMGLPSVVGFLAGHFYYLIDMWWIAQLPNPETAVAAVTIFSNITWFFYSFNHLVGAGSVAIIARRYGENDLHLAEAAIKETLLLKFGVGLLIGLLGFFFIEPLFYLAGARGETLAVGIGYGQVTFLGLCVSFSTFSIYTAMRGVANPRLAMTLMLSANMLNLILDPLFIFGYAGFPELGVVGAAVASVLSFGLVFLIGLVLFFIGVPNVKLNWHGQASMAWTTMWKMLKIGVPTWIGSASHSGARLVLIPMIAVFGNSVIAAYGIGLQVQSIGIAILVGIGLGLSSLIGHNVGAGKKERAKATANQAILLAIGVMAVLGVITFFAARPLMQLYFDSPETIGHGVTIIRLFSVFAPFLGLYFMIEEVYAGVGLNTPTMVFNIIQAWVIEIPVIFVLTQILHYSEVSVWLTINGSLVVTAIAFYFYYRRGQWLEVKV